MLITGKAIRYGDDINTDLIIAGKYTKTLNTGDLAAHACEDLDPDFHNKIGEGENIIVAGDYFGCGSSREQAPVALKESGVLLVAAKSFSRIFYRSAINIGLPLVECDTEDIEEGDAIEYEVGSDRLSDFSKGLQLRVVPLPDLMVKILREGGMVSFIKHGGYDSRA